MRVYALGVFGHAMVGVLSRPFFVGERRTWYPAVAMGIGLAITAVVAVAGMPLLHVYAVAAANGAGITTTAVLLLIGLRHRIVTVSLATVAVATGRLAAAATGAGAVGWLAGRAMAGWPPAVVAGAGGIAVLVAFAGLARLAGVDEVTAVASQLKRRMRHGR
jgi:putative peptidoglycan lipid II flippase